MTLTTYHNFGLLRTRAGARCKAIVVDAPAGEESAPFDPPFGWDWQTLAGFGPSLFP